MARPKSEDKRLALIDAATWAVSEFGLGASTALIAKQAGVAEGTLFRYFATKDVLFNEMYLYKKKTLGEILLKNHDSNQSIYLRSRQVWNNYIEWGLVNTYAHKALRQLTVSGRIGEDIENEAMSSFPDLQALCRAKLKGDLQPAEEEVFAGAIFYALAETTMDFAKSNPDRKQEFISSGFDVMWLGMMQDLPTAC